MFKVNNVNDLELLYTLLRENYPNNEINITYNYNTKYYFLQVSDKPYKEDPNVPVDLKIEVVYGDSVTADTPILLRNPIDNTIYIKSIENLGMKWLEYPEFKLLDHSIRLDKQYSELPLEVWCENGWNPIKKIIRHKTDKKIYRMVTNSGILDVTEDHSLCNNNMEKVKPNELQIGNDLLHSFPNSNNKTYKTTSKSKLEYGLLLGIFMTNCEIELGKEYYFKFKTQDYNYNLFNQFVNLFEKIEGIKLSIVNTNSNGIYTIYPISNTKYIIEKYLSLFYNFHDNLESLTKSSKLIKEVPNLILNSDVNIQNTFLRGVLGSNSFENKTFKLNNKLAAQGLYFLFNNIGINVHLNVNRKEDYIFYVSHEAFLESTSLNEHENTSITKIIKLNNNNNLSRFVYDIETEKGKFQAGIGKLIAYNTDSVFLKFNFNRNDFSKNRKDTFELASLCGDKLTKEVFKRPPIEMEFEKVFQPFVLLTKKRYIAKKYENVNDPFQLKGIDAKGIALTRRDYCQMVKTCYKDIIDAIMDDKIESEEEKIDNSIDVFKSYIKKIHKYDIDVNDLIVSAMLAKTYKSDNIAHVNLAKKLTERKEEVQVGDRIPYIYIECSDPKIKKSQLAEDPKYAQLNNLRFNRLCYLEQLAKPILGFYKVVLQNNETLLDDTIDYVNDKLVEYGGKKLKPSDFKLD